jgi:predicted transcriptional regulator
MKTLLRVAKDCGDVTRQRIIKNFMDKGLDRKMTVQEIAKTINLNWKPTNAHLLKMQAVGIMKNNREEIVIQTETGVRYEYGPATWEIHHGFKALIMSLHKELVVNPF